MFSKFIATSIFIYVAINIGVYFLSDHMLFLPPKSSYDNLNNIVKLKTNDGTTISALYLKNPSAKKVILYSHGNSEDLGQILPTLRSFYSWGFSVMAYDYHGYGTSEGKPNEQATYDDIAASYNYLIENEKISPSQIILFGRSLGSGPSVELAAQKPVGGVILLSPFTSVYRVVTTYPILLFDKYRNLAKINEIKAPILFIHGMQDEVVPFSHGQALYTQFAGNKESCWVKGVGHNDININSPQIRQAILSFIGQLKRS